MSAASPSEPNPIAHRAGVVALLGRPNSGKSTLLNALLGEKIAITSPRAQTTRSRVLGVLHRPGGQGVLIDTPGVHRGQRRFNRAMTEAAVEAARDADLRLLLLDARASWDEPEERLSTIAAPTLLLRTQCDRSRETSPVDTSRFEDCLRISAVTGWGLDRLVERMLDLLPVSPPLYPEDFLTDRPMRFLAAEVIREVAFEIYRDEVPYSIAVEIDEWRESERDVRIRASVLVERDAHKGIVVGEGGRGLKRLGTEARRRIGLQLEKPVHLNLWVKTDRFWTRRLGRARELGYL